MMALSCPPFEHPIYPKSLTTPDRNVERESFRPVLVATCVGIEKNDQPRVTSLLSVTSYESVTDELFDDALEEYLFRCARLHFDKNNDRTEMGKIIFTRFQSALEQRQVETEQEISLFRYILLSLSFSEQTIAFIRVLHPDDTFEEHICDLIDATETPMTAYAARRIIDNYPEKSCLIYVDLYDKAKEKNNESMMDLLEAKIKEIAPDCKKPTYLKTFPSGPLTLPDQEDPNSNVSLTMMATILHERLNTLGIQVRGKEHISVQCIASILASSNPTQRKILLDAITTKNDETTAKILTDETAVTIFRLLGPLNAFQDNPTTGPSDCLCAHYGGCRMFGCCEFEYDEEDEELVEKEGTEDWFTNNCEHCFSKIPNRFWSTRRPLYSGGWKGCYCSWGCVREGIYTLQLPDKEESSLISRTETMEADMHEIGIADQ
jgi:hypothetical protein